MTRTNTHELHIDTRMNIMIYGIYKCFTQYIHHFQHSTRIKTVFVNKNYNNNNYNNYLFMYDQGGTVSARARVSLVSWEGGSHSVLLWFRSVFRVRGPWPKRYGYHLSIIFIYVFILYIY